MGRYRLEAQRFFKHSRGKRFNIALWYVFNNAAISAGDVMMMITCKLKMACAGILHLADDIRFEECLEHSIDGHLICFSTHRFFYI